TAFGDAGRLKQIIQNLVSNAIKFTETGSIRVRLRTQKASTDVVVLFCEVSDTGIGVPQEQRSRLFNRFAQVDTPHRSKYGGSGLGLAISQQIVHLMGGEIGYLDNNGGGSTFWFHVPLLVRSTEQAEPALSSAADAQGTSEPAPCRILVVEDNEVNQKIALRLIEKSGHQAKAVSNGRLAVEELSTTAYDLVLMDVQMPEMDGFEATMAIRSLDKAIRSVPVIAMTANAMAGDRERCLQAGMDDYVSKPVNLKLLRKTIDKWLIRSRSGQTMLESEPVGSSAR
ncbi:MAG TPA: ATP-binding protein, partial [Bryobacteraceae bacterium]|nr:ATP-binding protein [Bryobacteraceae bacterium]